MKVVLDLLKFTELHSYCLLLNMKCDSVLKILYFCNAKPCARSMQFTVFLIPFGTSAYKN